MKTRFSTITTLFALTALLVPLSGFAQTAPEVFTYASESVAETSAVLKGAITAHYSGTRAWVEHGNTTVLGRITNLPQPVEPESKYDVRVTLSGLTPGSLYYYRVVAENAYGRRQGDIVSFTTLGNAPTNPPVTSSTNPGTPPPAGNPPIIGSGGTPSTAPTGCLSLTSGISESEFNEGDRVSYAVTYRNECESAYSAGTLTVVFPEGLEFVETNYTNYVRDGNKITYSLGTIASRFQLGISLTVNVGSEEENYVFDSALSVQDGAGKSVVVKDALHVIAVRGSGEMIKNLTGQISGIIPEMTKNVWFWIFLIPLMILAWGYRSLAKKKKNGRNGFHNEEQEPIGAVIGLNKEEISLPAEKPVKKEYSSAWNKEKLMGILENSRERETRKEA